MCSLLRMTFSFPFSCILPFTCQVEAHSWGETEITDLVFHACLKFLSEILTSLLFPSIIIVFNLQIFPSEVLGVFFEVRGFSLRYLCLSSKIRPLFSVFDIRNSQQIFINFNWSELTMFILTLSIMRQFECWKECPRLDFTVSAIPKSRWISVTWRDTFGFLGKTFFFASLYLVEGPQEFGFPTKLPK